jgi:hypothetical protein
MTLEEYEENEHSKESYAYFGLAVYYSQVLEHQLVNMIVLLKRSQGLIPTEDDYEALYQRKFSNTLGQLINEIKQLFQLKTEDIEELKEILRQRNFIVHEYFKEKINLTFTKTGRNILINELGDFITRLKIMDQKLIEYSNEIFLKFGITDEVLEDELHRVKGIERVKEIDGLFKKA